MSENKDESIKDSLENETEVEGVNPLLTDGDEDSSIDTESFEQPAHNVESSEIDEAATGHNEAQNGDSLTEDDDLAKAFEPTGFAGLLHHGRMIFADPSKRVYATLGVLLAVLTVVMAIPISRYAALNLAGVKGSATMTIVDAQTNTPVRDVSVQIGKISAKSDKKGKVQLDGLRLGYQQANISKTAYADFSKEVVVGTGANKLGLTSLDPVGSQLEFKVYDWLSGLPIEGAEAAYNDSDAASNTEGVIKLSIPPSDGEVAEVSVEAEGYIKKTVKHDLVSSKQVEIALVIDQPHYFLSERNGRYDIYRSAADGSSQALIIQGTGLERSDTSLHVAKDGKKAILIASRDGRLNKDGYPLRGLYSINLETASISKIDESEHYSVVGWVNNSLVAIKAQAGASGKNPERQRLISVGVDTAAIVQLASSNRFNGAMVAGNYVYFAPSDDYKDEPEPYLFRVDERGGSRKQIFDNEVWHIKRTDFDSMAFYDISYNWYEASFDSLLPLKLDAEPISRVEYIFESDQNGPLDLWVDQRDGQGVLLGRNTVTLEEMVIHSQAGLSSVQRWLSSEHLVFRVISGSESADYVVNISGGVPAKLSNVSATGSYSHY